MTYSIGFRAPSRAELIAHYCDHLLSELADDDRYADPALPLQTNPGEITAQALAKLHAMITEKLADRAAFARWFGSYSSTPKYPENVAGPDKGMTAKALRKALATGATLTRNPASRFAFVRQDADALWLFVDGDSFDCAGETATFAERLCSTACVSGDVGLSGSAAAMALIARLLNQGSVAFD
jgi:50S ribosomal protein L16 3-hydroxylase